MNIIDAMEDPNLFADDFDGDSWDYWKALLSGFYGLPTDQDKYQELTHLDPQGTEYDELWLCIGRRAGKSRIAALLAVYEACFINHAQHLAPGERSTVLVIAADRKQARSVMRYIRGLLDSPMLKRLVISDQAESIELRNYAVIEVATASHRATRGYTVSCCILDEIAFFRDQGANPDVEILSAIRPSLATLGGKLIALSSPYARRGVLWNTYHRHFGNNDSNKILVAQAPTLLMNHTLPEHIVEEALALDPLSAAAEYLAQFRSDVENFVTREVVDACTIRGRHELPYCSQYEYTAFVDPSGGAHDAFTMAIAHLEKDIVVIDAIRVAKPPFSPSAVTESLCDFLQTYNITKVSGDRYAGQWVSEQFVKHHVAYHQSPAPKNELYTDLLPVLNSQLVELLDDKQLYQELVNLERRTSRTGRDIVDHPPSGYDDIANAVAGVVAVTRVKKEQPLIEFRFVV